MPEITVRADKVGVKFNIAQEKVDSLKEYAIKLLRRELMYKEFWALRDVSFTLERGDRLGVLGLNGAGKSTLMKVVAGVYKPTEGAVERHGRLAPLIELGAGFDSDYTGAENIYLYGSVLGLSRSYLSARYEEIVSFAELGEFINVPLKNYSSGMRSRLGFAIATVVEPEILILDEVLSVGDAKFRKKCLSRMEELFSSGTTVLFVSHSLDQVEQLCNKAIILDRGRMTACGPVAEVAAGYRAMIG